MEITDTIAKINALLDVADKPDAEKEEPDWEAESEASDLLPQVFMLHRYGGGEEGEEGGDGLLKHPVRNCGSHGFKDTPRVLYRLLYLFAKQGRRWPLDAIAPRPGSRPWLVDFGDMYKSCSLFAIVSPDYRMVADPQFYKYEISLTWRAAEEHVEGREHGVICGVPGHDNGVRAGSPELRAWQDLLVRLLSREWSVYSGNNFTV